MPFLITEHVRQQHNLDPTDVGKWGVVIKGTISIFNSEEAARELWDLLLD